MNAPVPVVPGFWWAAEEVLGGTLPGFAPRESQRQLVAHLWDVLSNRRRGAVEAPTGSGKSYASLLVAEALPGRVVISTATRSLQLQYQRKDVPLLRSAGLLSKEVVVLGGRSRYLCAARAERESKVVNAAAKRVLKKVLAGAGDGDGTRDGLPVPVPDWLWERVCSDPDACRAGGCTAVSCAYLAARAAARVAGIVIVNHSLLLADASIKGRSALAWGRRSPGPEERDAVSVLGPYRFLVVDEAHALEGAAESFGERRVSVRGVQALAGRVSKVPFTGAAVADLGVVAAEVGALAGELPQGALLEPFGGGPVLVGAVAAAKHAAREVRSAGGDGDAETEVLAGLCSGLAERLEAVGEALVSGEDELGARAVSAERGALVSQLVDAGPWLSGWLWDQVPSVLVSGTLGVPGRAGFVVERAGLGGVPVVGVPEVFDLASQRLVFVTPRADSGGGARVGPEDVEELVSLLEVSRGRALVLFSAYQDLKFVFGELVGRVGHLVLGQGVTPAEGVSGRGRGAAVPMGNARLAEVFHSDVHSVLLATRSFFEGVDFPGDSCSVVAVMRFPNVRPDDPLTLARRRSVESRGGSGWAEYQEPVMQLVFRQAAGRVIRRVDDRGVVAVLDPRSGSKGYARRALLGLVPSDFTMSLGDVGKFLEPR